MFLFSVAKEHQRGKDMLFHSGAGGRVRLLAAPAALPRAGWKCRFQAFAHSCAARISLGTTSVADLDPHTVGGALPWATVTLLGFSVYCCMCDIL